MAKAFAAEALSSLTSSDAKSAAPCARLKPLQADIDTFEKALAEPGQVDLSGAGAAPIASMLQQQKEWAAWSLNVALVAQTSGSLKSSLDKLLNPT